jgi:hypothetical protein
VYFPLHQQTGAKRDQERRGSAERRPEIVKPTAGLSLARLLDRSYSSGLVLAGA